MGRKPTLGERPADMLVLRLPDEIGRRIDGYAETMGIKNRSEAVRQLILLGLAAHYEAERKRTTPKKRRR
jgi:metal-responsive CopG/Arc/MetJ family transcriptional regulator